MGTSPTADQKDPIATPPLGQTNPFDSPAQEKHRYDVTEVLNGRKNRQLFINRITDAKIRPKRAGAFLINTVDGDAMFGDESYPYIGSGKQLIVPTTIIASRRQILNVGAFSAYQNAVQNIPNNVSTTQVYNVASYDEDSALVLATGIWTPKQAGIYHLSGAAGFNAAVVVVNKYISVAIYKNGVTGLVGATNHVNTANDAVAVCSIDVSMNGTTDYCTFQVLHNFGAATNTWGVQLANCFSGHKVD